MTSPEQWARRAATLPAALVDATPRAVRAGAEPLADQARDNLRRASGGDLRLSRVRSGKGARVDVDVKVSGTGSRARALVVPVGPVSLLEKGARAHTEPFRYVAERTSGRRDYSMARRRKAQRRGFLFIPGVGIRTRVRHPGTHASQPVRNAMRQANAVAGRAGVAVFQRAIREHLGRG